MNILTANNRGRQGSISVVLFDSVPFIWVSKLELTTKHQFNGYLLLVNTVVQSMQYDECLAKISMFTNMPKQFQVQITLVVQFF